VRTHLFVCLVYVCVCVCLFECLPSLTLSLTYLHLSLSLSIRCNCFLKVDVGHLKDVLMMDMLPSSIGVLTWREEDEDADGDGGRYFEPVLCKGQAVPSTGVRTFSLEHNNQKIVSIDVYEEVEEYVHTYPRASNLPPIMAAAREVTAKAASSSHRPVVTPIILDPKTRERRKEITYIYDLIGTYDFLVPEAVRYQARAEGEAATVDVVFCMSAEGALTFSVEVHKSSEENGGILRGRKGKREGEGGDGGLSKESEDMMWMLGVYLTLMFFMYLVVKILLNSPEVREISSSTPLDFDAEL
jgi:hypothetical protein